VQWRLDSEESGTRQMRQMRQARQLLLLMMQRMLGWSSTVRQFVSEGSYTSTAGFEAQ
jgi:hypothetical protein